MVNRGPRVEGRARKRPQGWFLYTAGPASNPSLILITFWLRECSLETGHWACSISTCTDFRRSAHLWDLTLSYRGRVLTFFCVFFQLSRSSVLGPNLSNPHLERSVDISISCTMYLHSRRKAIYKSHMFFRAISPKNSLLSASLFESVRV